jgi:hypothetical protein
MRWANPRTHAERIVLEQVVSIFRGMNPDAFSGPTNLMDTTTTIAVSILANDSRQDERASNAYACGTNFFLFNIHEAM